MRYCGSYGHWPVGGKSEQNTKQQIGSKNDRKMQNEVCRLKEIRKQTIHWECGKKNNRKETIHKPRQIKKERKDSSILRITIMQMSDYR